jgi:hypothetical protein
MSIDSTVRVGRRAVLTGATGAVVAALAGVLANVQRTLAVGDDGKPLHVGDRYAAAGSRTSLGRTDGGVALEGTTSGAGTAIRGVSESGAGLYGSSPAGYGVRGVSVTGEAISGVSLGVGVHGRSDSGDPLGFPVAVLGETGSARGVAVLGVNEATDGRAQGLQGTSASPAGWASTGWASGGGTGLLGVSAEEFPNTEIPADTGVYAHAPHGRGIVAVGGMAQLRLVPSLEVTHPVTGLLGDLLLDNLGRLWFCRGGDDWTQLA